MAAASLDQLVTSATHRLQTRFGREPRWIVAAPGRVNLIGEHVDYNNGFVLPMAIDRYCVIAAADDANDQATLYSVATDDEVRINLRESSATGSASAEPGRNNTYRSCSRRVNGHWSNYIEGVISGFAKQNLRPGGFTAVIESSVPVGGGLSSSAAIEVATATLLEAMTGSSLAPVQKALLCQKAEHEFAGMPCGIMDQFASVLCQLDHLMLLDCCSQQFRHVPFNDPAVTVLIVNSNIKHALTGGEYAERRGQCESAARKLNVASLRDVSAGNLEVLRDELTDSEYHRAQHVVSEIARTIEAESAITAGDWPQMGRLMYESHASLRDDFAVSCRELDLLVEFARDLGLSGGIFGSRMTGAGFGGCTVSLVDTGKINEAATTIASRYAAETGVQPSIILSRPAQGAQIIKGH